MTSRFADRRQKPSRLRAGYLLIASVCAMLAAVNDPAGAASRRSDHSVQSVDSRTPGEPLMAIVSLRSQRVTIYDASGWMLRAPVSSGQRGRETPAGIFSVLQK